MSSRRRLKSSNVRDVSCSDEIRCGMKEILSGLLKYASKIPVRDILVTVCVSSWFMLFAPNSVLAIFGLLSVRDSQRQVIGLILLISTTLVTVLSVRWAWRFICSCFAYSGRDAKRRLDAVGEWNRGLIRQLYETPSHSQKLPLQDANVQALLSENIIFHSRFCDAIGFECGLQPWVFHYLDKHPDYVSKIKKLENPYICKCSF